MEIRLIIESKLGSFFSTVQFRINGFSSPYRFDRNAHAPVTHEIWYLKTFENSSKEPRFISKHVRFIVIGFLLSNLLKMLWKFFWRFIVWKIQLRGLFFFFENPGRFFCVDLIPTNKKKTFQTSQIIKSRISKFNVFA